ncbi:hypothetical protein HH310_19940 [Actinoplanes sp. TBRC 11911]|uniref:hypothetical protein n=1 Tax=Actinoplanes sp. TBRC 11911 TaxID=2729386 RepID=UPI00145CF4AE|nr:hypothetical protein [Actinoplanes sp. TBRC 11911]NMO53447.1 hypothetical protein [Actinoplanes sp. TBRC 11911]
MEYGVSVVLGLSSGGPKMDPLQVEGAASLLSRILDEIDAVDGPEGVDVVLDRYWVGAHPEGASVLLVIEADSLPVAEAAAREVVVSVLKRSELLADWRLVKCEVALDERFAEVGLQVPDDAELPPADPAERAIWHRHKQRGLADPARSEGEIDWRGWTMRHAEQMRAFNREVFDGVDGQSDEARLAAGALIFAATLLVDELFEDIETLRDSGNDTPTDGDHAYFVLGGLPDRFAHRYDLRFTRNFLIVTIVVTGRLTQPHWASPASVAEALALHVLVERARAFLEMHDLLDADTIGDLYSAFEDAAFDDLDHEFLYRRELDGFEDDEDFTSRMRVTNMRVEEWFRPVNLSDAHVHPYTVDVSAPRTGRPQGS